MIGRTDGRGVQVAMQAMHVLRQSRRLRQYGFLGILSKKAQWNQCCIVQLSSERSVFAFFGNRLASP